MKSVLIIAEAGVNHNGNLNKALQMVEAASDAGADVVKFQIFRTELSISRKAEKAEYQKATTGADESQFSMVKKLELSDECFAQIAKHCEKYRIEFMATPFDVPSVAALERIGVRRYKVASGEYNNVPLLRAMARTGRPIIVSTGNCTLKEVRQTLTFLKNEGVSDERISVLHCNTEYPSPDRDMNLLAIRTLRDEFGTKVGLSDHSIGIDLPIASIALGAEVVEKHFTLDRTLPGPDHQASLEPGELKSMVRAIRRVSEALGTGEKVPTPSEVKNRTIIRKSLVALRRIRKGELYSEDNIGVKRPSGGLSPWNWDSVIGQPAPRTFEADELISLD